MRRGVRYANEKLNAKPGVFASLVDVVVTLLVRHIDIILVRFVYIWAWLSTGSEILFCY